MGIISLGVILIGFMRYFWLCSSFAFLVSLPARAQIIPDSTLGTQVTPNVVINGVMSERLDGGSIRGANLFHSFSEFNIQAGKGAYFTNPDGVTNIFTRVTGGNPSNINGTLGVLGNANLLFINPNGIIFGEAAKLDLNASFLGATASSIKFADGSEFSMDNTPLLSVSVPVGLGFGSSTNSQPGTIKIQGTGHNLTFNSIFAPISNQGNSNGLAVKPGNTIVLVGGNVTLDSGVISAPMGRVEIGAVSNTPTQVRLASTPQGWMLGYEGVQSFQDISLNRNSLLNVSGFNSGTVNLQGRQIFLRDGSAIFNQNFGVKPSGNINIQASESLELNGVSPDKANISSIISSQSLGTGKGADLNISTHRFIIKNGGVLQSSTYNSANSGNIAINATDLIEMKDEILSSNPNATNGIYASTAQSGKGGSITLSTNKLSISGGSDIVASNRGSGTGGNVIVNSKDIEVTGINPNNSQITNLSSNSLGTGNGGNILINTAKLKVTDGGLITSGAFASGHAGTININASESVKVINSIAEIPELFVSRINSSARISPPSLQQFLRVPPVPSGDAGVVTINTPYLEVKEGNFVTVRNEGTGNGGTLQINAEKIFLDNRAMLSANTASGEGGNIILQASDILLRGNSIITTEAKGTGNGGYISINADTLTQLENSDITANAVRGNGGKIEISTQGLFSSDSKITATSQLGISGVINITNPSVNQQNNLQQQSSNFITTDNVVATSCLATHNAAQGKFVVTGNGGLRQTPNNDLELPYSVVQVLPVNNQTLQSQSMTTQHIWHLSGNSIQEATQLIRTSDGRLLLQAKNNENYLDTEAVICH